MFGIAVLLAALSMAGAPANTSVTCDPSLHANEGTTFWPTASTDPTTASVTLGPNACAALLLLSASPAERAEIAALNSGRNLQILESAIEVVLHEASHVGLRSHDETLVQCNAMRLLPDFLAKYLSGIDLANAIDFAKQADSFLPTSYHAYACPS